MPITKNVRRGFGPAFPGFSGKRRENGNALTGKIPLIAWNIPEKYV